MFRKKKPTLEDLLVKSGIDIYYDVGRVVLDTLFILGYRQEDHLRDLNISVSGISTYCAVWSRETDMRILTIWLNSWNPRPEWIIDTTASKSVRFHSDYNLSGKSLILP